MYSIRIVLDDGTFKEISDLSHINLLNSSNGINEIKENEFQTFIPYNNYFYSFISNDEIYTIHGKHIKTLNFYK